ncbi:MAG: hypothetical protein [Inoviridae sp.]|nr:MAG: hypothetical protein [Inoviridae sp.]
MPSATAARAIIAPPTTIRTGSTAPIEAAADVPIASMIITSLSVNDNLGNKAKTPSQTRERHKSPAND